MTTPQPMIMQIRYVTRQRDRFDKPICRDVAVELAEDSKAARERAIEFVRKANADFFRVESLTVERLEART